jgi:hypothetical protein
MGKGGVREDLPVIFKTDKGDLPDRGELAEGQVDAPEKRQQKTDNKRDKGGQDKYDPVFFQRFSNHNKTPVG